MSKFGITHINETARFSFTGENETVNYKFEESDETTKYSIYSEPEFEVGLIGIGEMIIESTFIVG